MSGWFPLVRAWVAQGPYSGVVDLAATADPALALVPGQRFRLAMTVTPSGGAHRTYGYLLGEDLGGAVVLEELQHLQPSCPTAGTPPSPRRPGRSPPTAWSGCGTTPRTAPS